MLFSYVGNITSKNDQCTVIVYETVHSVEAVLCWVLLNQFLLSLLCGHSLLDLIAPLIPVSEVPRTNNNLSSH